MLILKQNAANSVPTPPAGKGTIFLDDSDTLSVKTSDGNVENFPTVAASNSQVVFMNGSSLSGESALTYDFNNNILSVTGNVAAGNVKTDNLLYANGNPWDLSDPGGSNTQIQFNDDESFGGSAAFTFDKTSNLVTVGANLSANNVNVTTHITSGNVWANSGTISAQTLKGEGGNISNIQGANVSGTVGSATTAGTVTTNAQPNITSVGTLSSLVVSGTANTGAMNPTGHIIPTAAATYDLGSETNPWRDLWVSGNSIRIGNSRITSNATSLVLQNPDGGQVVVSGNSVASSTSIVSGTSNVSIPSANGNVNTSVGGTANVLVITATGANVAGYANITGNANVGNLGTAGLITATGNVSGGNLTTAGVVAATGNVSGGNLTTAGVVAATGNVTTAAQLVSSVSTGTAPLVVTSTTRVANLDVAKAGVANTVNDAAQPNITSVGTLTSLGVSGTITAANITANTGVFTGNGAALTNLAGGNVTGQVGNALVAGTVYTNAQPNITSVGTLTSLGVSGTITAANITANTGIFTGNGSGLSSITGANVTGEVAYAATANAVAGANVSGQVSNALVSGTVYTNAQPNITSVGTLTSLVVTGNATAGNVYANSGTIGASLIAGTLTTASQPNITSLGTLTSLSATGTITGGNLTTTGVLTVSGTGVSSIAGNLDMTSNTIINLATPTNDYDAATKKYVDDVAQGLNVHDSCAAATPDTLANITSGTITYNNGTAGVGAYLLTTGTFNLIDGVNVQTAGTRILVKNEANAVHNGIYTYTNTTAITRAVDFDSIPEVEAGDFTFITGGTLYDNTGWVQTSSPAAIGTAGNTIDFTQFSGAGTYNAGTGLTLTGPTFSVNASQTQVTALGNVTTGTWNSLVGSSATFAAGLSGANLASITGANVTGQVANAAVAGTVYTNAQPNITSVGTLTGLGVSGTITAANITANTGVFTGNGSGLSALAGGNVTGQVANALVAGTVYTASQPNITSVGTLTSLGVSGAVTASTLVSNVATGTAPLTVTSTTRVANLDVAKAGIANTVNDAAQPNITSVGTLTSLTVTGNASAGNISTGGVLSVTGNANVGNLGTAGLIVATGNVSGGNVNATSAVVASTLTSNVATGTAPLTVTSTTRVANLNVAYANVADFINISDVTTGTYYPVLANAATGNVAEGSNSALTFAAATGTLSATVFSGSGTSLTNLNASNISSGTLAQARLANASVTLGSTALTLGSTVTTVAGLTSVTSTTFVGALSGAATTAGTVTTAAQPNITSVGTLTSLSSSGNIVAPNVQANTGYFISSVNAAVSAAGTAQGNATVIASMVNVVSTVASGAGVALPTAVAGMRITLINTSANALLVYPASGGAINSGATNASFSQVAGGRLDFVATSTTQWYTLNATYA